MHACGVDAECELEIVVDDERHAGRATHRRERMRLPGTQTRVGLLARYWIAAAPPAIAARTLATSAPVSGSSGVSAYSPDGKTVIARGPAGRLAHVEQSVRNRLARARAEGVRQGLPGPALRRPHRLRHGEPVRESRGNRGGERAPEP